MKLWKEPSESENLYLPNYKLSNGNKKIYCIDPKLNIKISHKFLTFWHQGPTNKKNLTNIAKCVAYITKTFAKFCYFNTNNLPIMYKSHHQDIVTHIDQGIEILFRIWIKKHFPQDLVIGEECQNKLLKPTKGTWYIDPIDGTSNFINQQPNFALQLCYVKNNEPLMSYLYLPKKKKSFLAVKGNKIKPLKIENKLCIGTEFLDHKIKQKQTFIKLSNLLNANSYRIKAIGPHLLNLFQANSSAFYKEDIKIWDLLPPLAFLKLKQHPFWKISLYTNKNYINKIEPFDTSQETLNYYNNCQKNNFRIGTIIITPNNLPDLEKKIISMLKKQC